MVQTQKKRMEVAVDAHEETNQGSVYRNKGTRDSLKSAIAELKDKKAP